MLGAIAEDVERIRGGAIAATNYTTSPATILNSPQLFEPE